jgi:hypothetical protein
MTHAHIAAHQSNIKVLQIQQRVSNPKSTTTPHFNSKGWVGILSLNQQETIKPVCPKPSQSKFFHGNQIQLSDVYEFFPARF